MKDAALIIFQKKPERGKVKTRLAISIGDQKAVEAYQFLLNHTHRQVALLDIPVHIYFEKNVQQEFLLNPNYRSAIQRDGSLGEKMQTAFREVFHFGYQKVVIIGTDCLELNADDIKDAFCFLNSADVVIGPAVDGGYYLLGMKGLHGSLFENKAWSSSSVFADTMADIKQLELSVQLLKIKSDVDVYEDLPKEIKAVLGIQ